VRLFKRHGTEQRDWLRRNKLAIIISIAFTVMAAFNFEQARVIDAQRTLIQLLSGDSSELAMRRVQDLRRHR
jgi:hypothetical protein